MWYKFSRLTYSYGLNRRPCSTRYNHRNHNRLSGFVADLQHHDSNWCHLLHMDTSHRLGRDLCYQLDNGNSRSNKR